MTLPHLSRLPFPLSVSLRLRKEMATSPQTLLTTSAPPHPASPRGFGLACTHPSRADSCDSCDLNTLYCSARLCGMELIPCPSAGESCKQQGPATLQDRGSGRDTQSSLRTGCWGAVEGLKPEVKEHTLLAPPLVRCSGQVNQAEN